MPSASHSAHNPRLRIVWSASSLYSLMFCPRRLQYEQEGWRTRSVDFDFGRMVHEALEVFDHALLDGKTWEEAQAKAVAWAVRASGRWTRGDGAVLSWEEASKSDADLAWEPWGGEYVTMWRCTHNPGPGKKKCPYAHAGKWFPWDAPAECGECGSPTETQVRWVPDDPAKNRETLIRLVAWYCEEWGPGPVRPMEFPDGTRGVELDFEIPLGIENRYGEAYSLCGRFDGMAQTGAEVAPRERKTTKSSIGPWYFDNYVLNVQTDTYDLVGALLYPSLGMEGVLLEVMQTTKDGAAFHRRMLHSTEPQRAEWLEEIRAWVRQAEVYAEEGHWPMNKVNCGRCGFRGVCSKEPEKRARVLEEGFERRERA